MRSRVRLCLNNEIERSVMRPEKHAEYGIRRLLTEWILKTPKFIDQCNIVRTPKPG